MIVREHANGRWYVVARHYPASQMAKRAWERADRKLDLHGDDRGIGLYRMTPGPGGLDSGCPHGAHAVAAITLDEATARKAERLLSDGTDFTPTNDFADALIARRTRVVLSASGQRGRLSIRRPENRGAQLDPSGNMHEPEPGRG